MKSTEAIDESVESSGPVLAAGESAGAADPSMLDQRRRRLVRGAVAIAPLVLTLRSGALAAASCTGLKITSAETTPNTDKRPGKIKNSIPVAPIAGDICVDRDYLEACPGDPNPNRVLTKSLGSVDNTERVVERLAVYDTGKPPPNNFRIGKTKWLSCGGADDATGTPGKWVGKNIAIMSSQACSSLMGGGACG